MVSYLLFVCRLRTDSVHNRNAQRSKEGPVKKMNVQQTTGACRFAVAHRICSSHSNAPQSHKTSAFPSQDFTRLNKDTMTGRSLCLMSPSSHQKQTITVTAFFSPLKLPLLRVRLFICPHRFGGCLIQQTRRIARSLMGFHTVSLLWEIP